MKLINLKFLSSTEVVEAYRSGYRPSHYLTRAFADVRKRQEDAGCDSFKPEFLVIS